MSRYYVCDWCGYKTQYIDDIIPLSVNDAGFQSPPGSPASMHICMVCLPETPMSDLMVEGETGHDLDDLPEIARADFEAVVINGLSHEEQAERRDVTANAVRNNIMRANRQLSEGAADDA